MGEERPWAWLALGTGNPENMSAHKVWLRLKLMLPHLQTLSFPVLGIDAMS